MADTDADMTMWTRLEAASGMTQGMFTSTDVEEAKKASKFNGTILKPGDSSHRLTQEIPAQILGLLN